MRHSLVRFIGTTLTLCLAVTTGGAAIASQSPNADPSNWVLTYPSGLSITYSETGNAAMTVAEMTANNIDPNWPGMSSNAYFSNSFASSPYSRPDIESPSQLSWYSQTWGGTLAVSSGMLSKPTCPVTATRGVEMRCERDNVKFTFSRPVTNPVIHFNNLGANSFSVNNDWDDQRLWMHSDTILTLDTASSVYSGTPGLTLESHVGNMAVVTDGANYLLPAGSPLTGALAITRTADRSIDTTNRPGGHYVGGSFGAGSVKVQGTWTELVFNRDLLWSFDTFSATTSPWRTVNTSLQTRNECILNQVPSSTIYRCDGSGTTWTPNNSVNITAAVYDGLQVWNPTPEGTSFVISTDEDFGTAPASYDGTNGASHVISNLSIGQSSTSTGTELSSANGGVNGIVSPNAGGSDSNDDAFSANPMLPATGDFTIAVPLTGITSPAKLCGWIDTNANGSFDTGERECVNVTANSTSANLTWNRSSISSITSATWMRLRVSYDTTGVESPQGRLDSGEVEDWKVQPYSAPTTTTTTTTVAPSIQGTTSLPATGNSFGLLVTLALFTTGSGVLLTRRRRAAVR